MAAEFRDVLLKTDTREAIPDAAAQSDCGAAFGLHCVAKNIAHFLFHAMAVATRLPLKSSLNAIFQISDNQLRHRISPSLIS